MLSRRLISAAIGIPLLVAVIFAGGWIYNAVVAVALGAATVEMLIESGLRLTSPLPWLSGLAAGLLAIAAIASAPATALLLTVFLVASLLVAAPLTEEGSDPWSLGIAVALYAGWLGRYLVLLRHGTMGRELVFFAVIVTFASDTGAYAIGRLFGRHRLAPSISPGKTVEGTVGGFVFAACLAVLAGFGLGLWHSLYGLLLLGLAVSLAAQVGDLGESALKRRLGVKDAGHLIPGHGGLFDRLDSLLVAGAVVYYAVQWMSL